MALRLRRGTDAQRLLITPLEGELIYVTDTQEIYVGDGVTAGGIRVTGLVPENLEDLQNVSSAVPGDNDVLIWSAIDGVWTPIPLDTIAPGSTIASLSDVNVTTIPVLENDVLAFNVATEKWEPSSVADLIVSSGTLQTDIKGSVFADDSRTLIDAEIGIITGDVRNGDVSTNYLSVTRDGNDIKIAEFITQTTGGANDIEFLSYRGTVDAKTDVQVGDGAIDLVSRSWHTNDYRSHSLVRFRTDPNGSFDNPTAGLPGSILFSVFNDQGVQSLAGTMELKQDGLLVGAFANPNNDRLRVGGNASFDGDVVADAFIGSFFADDSTQIVDGLLGKIVGDVDNLNVSTETLIVRKGGDNVKLAEFITETTGGANDIEFLSYRGTEDAKANVQVGDGTIDLLSKSWHSDGYRAHSLIRFRTDPAGTFSNPTAGLPGSILFSVFDDLGTQRLEGTMELKQDGLLVGTVSNPNNDRLRVGGNASFDGDIRADAFIGSYFVDDSTMIVDGLTGQVVGDVNNLSVTTENLIVSKPGDNIKLAQFFTQTTGGANDIEFLSYRGTEDAKTDVQVGDGVVDLLSKSWHSDGYRAHSLIRLRTDPAGTFSNPTAGLPGSILFSVFDDAGTQGLAGTMELKQDGLLVGSISNPNNDRLRVGGSASFTGAITPGVYADATARDADITAPVEGMMVFLQDIQKFVGYFSDTGLASGGVPNSTPGWVPLN